MNISKKVMFAAIAIAVMLSGCATPPPKEAIKKTYAVQGQKLELGGTYQPKSKELIITINNEPIMKGTFPPFTPTMKLNGKYKNFQISGDCYFGSVLGSQKGLVGIIAGAVQSGNSKTSDKCDMLVDSKAADSLYF